MSDDLVHPTPDFDEDDVETRQLLEMPVTLERFYWVHLDWYEAQGFLDGRETLEAFLSPVFDNPEREALENWLRHLVDHYYLPTAIRAGIAPFDELDEETRIALTRDAEIFQN